MKITSKGKKLEMRILYMGDEANIVIYDSKGKVMSDADCAEIIDDVADRLKEPETTTVIKENSDTWGLTFRCGKCKCQIEDYHNFCPNCGRKIESEGGA